MTTPREELLERIQKLTRELDPEIPCSLKSVRYAFRAESDSYLERHIGRLRDMILRRQQRQSRWARGEAR